MKTTLSSVETKLTSGSPYWAVHNRAPSARHALSGEVECDVAVIGGGITGALVSYRLAKEQVETVLLEKHTLASGSTSASTALISYEFDELLTALEARFGKRRAARAYRLSFEAVSSLEGLVNELEDACDYDRKVSIRVTNDPADGKEFEAEAKARNREGLNVAVIDRAELMDRYAVVAELGLVAQDAAQIDPYKLTHRLVNRSAKAGLRVFERTKVTGYEAESMNVVLTTSRGGKVKAKRVVFATGYESEKYLEKNLGILNTDYCMVSHPLRNMEKIKRCHIVENADNYLYASTFGDRVMVGVEVGSFQSPGERARRIPGKTREIVERISAYLPGHTFSKDYHWAATFAKSKDSLPYLVQSPRFPQAWFVLGYGGNGIASSALLSSLVCDIVRGKSNPDVKLFSFDR